MTFLPRYSLRTLLIVTLIMAAALGAWSAFVKAKEQRWRYLARWEQRIEPHSMECCDMLFGTPHLTVDAWQYLTYPDVYSVKFTGELPEPPSDIAELTNRARSLTFARFDDLDDRLLTPLIGRQLQGFSVVQSRIDRSTLEGLSRTTQLKELTIVGCGPVKPAILNQISKLPALEECRVEVLASDLLVWNKLECPHSLACMKLVVLHPNQGQVDDCPDTTELGERHFGFLQGCVNLKELVIVGNVSHEARLFSAEQLPRLTELTLSWSIISEELLLQIASLPMLKQLRIDQCYMSADAMKAIVTLGMNPEIKNPADFERIEECRSAVGRGETH
jgi:hypothetical protein